MGLIESWFCIWNHLLRLFAIARVANPQKYTVTKVVVTYNVLKQFLASDGDVAISVKVC